MILDKDSFGIRGFFIRKAFKAVFLAPERNTVKALPDSIVESPVSLYIHFPFCKSLCPACPYVRYLYDRRTVERYLNSLQKEIQLYGSLVKDLDLRVSDVHVGGGTPSLIGVDVYRKIFECISENFELAHGFDFGIEANPNDLTEDYAFGIREVGISSISIGIQSFSNPNLKVLGRIHRATDNFSAIENSLAADFEHVNIDMMYFLPGQRVEDWVNDIETATQLGVDQVTLYPLLIVRYRVMNRLLREGKLPQQPGRRRFNIFYRKAVELLRDGGYHPVRYYSFSRSPREYSTVEREMVGPLLGLGCGAIGFTGKYEYVNTCYPQEYIRKISEHDLPIAGIRRVEEKERFIRWIQERLSALTLRKSEFRKFFGIDFDRAIARIPFKYSLWLDKVLGNLEVTGDCIRLTEKGMAARNWAGWAFVLNVPCRIVEEYLKEPWPSRVKIP